MGHDRKHMLELLSFLHDGVSLMPHFANGGQRRTLMSAATQMDGVFAPYFRAVKTLYTIGSEAWNSFTTTLAKFPHPNRPILKGAFLYRTLMHAS